jgi:hypothetical protein
MHLVSGGMGEDHGCALCKCREGGVSDRPWKVQGERGIEFNKSAEIFYCKTSLFAVLRTWQ